MNTEAKFTAHEVLCLERHNSINVRLKRIENVIWSSAGILICGMGSVIWQLANLGHH